MKKLLFLLIVPVLLFSQNVKQVELDDINGDLFVMNDHLDYEATVISFWATWCLPCKKEQPALQSVLEELDDARVQVISISIDSPRSLAKVKKYVRSHDFDFTFLLDPSGEISRDLLVNEVPYTMLVNRKGDVVFTHTGYRQGDEKLLKEEILKLLKQD